MGIEVKTNRVYMNKTTIKRARIILDRIEELQQLKETIKDKYVKLSPKSNREELEDVFTLIVKNGYSCLFFSSYLQYRKGNRQSDRRHRSRIQSIMI